MGASRTMSEMRGMTGAILNLIVLVMENWGNPKNKATKD